MGTAGASPALSYVMYGKLQDETHVVDVLETAFVRSLDHQLRAEAELCAYGVCDRLVEGHHARCQKCSEPEIGHDNLNVVASTGQRGTD